MKKTNSYYATRKEGNDSAQSQSEQNFVLKLVFFEPLIRIELISMLYKSIALTDEL